jgi:hypothetical protein
MNKAPIAVLVAALSGGVALSRVDFHSDSKRVAEVGQALVAGVILGADVWSYNVGPRPTDMEARLLPRAAVCDWRGQCDSTAAVALTGGSMATAIDE